MDRPISADPAIAEVWQAHHRYLVNLAARTLGDRTEAEDVVQEAFGRLTTVPLAELDDVRGWLTVVVRRLSLNRLRSAYRRREESVGAPVGDLDDDPADRITLDDQVQQALAVVLDRLSPAERTAFVLHDVFGFPFDAVGEIVGRTAAACRQLASRARRSIQSDAPPLAPAPTSVAVARTAERRRELAERFAAACAGGDIGELMAVLDPDVAGDAVLVGGRLLNHVEGAAAVASRIVALLGPDSGATLVPMDLEGQAGVVALDRGRFVAAIRLDEQDGLVHHIHTFVVRPVPAATVD
ncbi:MAG TPA: sigma-70 family RNA polymerase sigma factor [Acidimicrobiales bacterium]|nr:sigma-70 family RNA polymerase sigma factor [Acidimicrobiales bacterium]